MKASPRCGWGLNELIFGFIPSSCEVLGLSWNFKRYRPLNNTFQATCLVVIVGTLRLCLISKTYCHWTTVQLSDSPVLCSASRVYELNNHLCVVPPGTAGCRELISPRRQASLTQLPNANSCHLKPEKRAVVLQSYCRSCSRRVCT